MTVVVCKNVAKINLKACNFQIFLRAHPQTPIALACFVQHNKHNFLHQTLAGYVADSTENKFGPSLWNIFLHICCLVSWYYLFQKSFCFQDIDNYWIWISKLRKYYNFPISIWQLPSILWMGNKALVNEYLPKKTKWSYIGFHFH